MTKDEALSVLIQGVNVAQRKGAYTLDDAAVIHQAVKLFIEKQPVAAEVTAEPVESIKPHSNVHSNVHSNIHSKSEDTLLKS